MDYLKSIRGLEARRSRLEAEIEQHKEQKDEADKEVES